MNTNENKVISISSDVYAAVVAGWSTGNNVPAGNVGLAMSIMGFGGFETLSMSSVDSWGDTCWDW